MTNTTFKDHFSSHAGDYASYRPHYPDTLFDWLAQQAPDLELAWDCATGNGQAARGLAQHFQRVIATDASAQQVAAAQPTTNIDYRTAPAEVSGLVDNSVSLITVAQALHWFDLPAFFREAERVLKPDGILAVWSYNLLEVTPEINTIVNRIYDDILGPYWPPERRQVEQGYSDVAFPPFPTITPPDFAMTAHWTLEQLIGYLGTWSALRRYMAEHDGADPRQDILPQLQQAWGNAGKQEIRWPLALWVGSKPV